MSNVITRSGRPSLLLACGALVVGLVAASGGVAGAKTAPVDATHYTVTCTGFAGSVKFSQPETTSGTATPSPATDTLKVTLSGCTVAAGGGTPVAVTKASLTGALTNSSSYHKCGANNGTPVAITGSLTVKWKTTPKLTASSTVIAGSSATITSDVSANAAEFEVDGSTTSGPFEGSNSGASDQIAGSTGAGTGTGLLASCAGKKGLKGLTLTNPLSGPSASLS